MKTIKIKVKIKKEGTDYYKNHRDIVNEAEKKFRKELKENLYLRGWLLHEIDNAMKGWDSSQLYYSISL